nr:ABC transporter permease subunit [Flavimaribacter sediminis]
MIDRAFTYQDRGGETAMLAIEIDRAYTKRFQLEQQVQRAQNAADAEPGASAPSVSAPSATPSIGAPAATTPSAGGLPQPSAGGAANQEIDVEALEAEIATLTAKIEELESQEDLSSGEAGMKATYSLKNFTTMSGIHFQIFVMTLLYAFCVTILSFLICYPVAFVIATTTNRNRLALMMLGLVIPYAINELLRIFSWIMILEKNGILNTFLNFIGIIDIDAGEGIRFVASNGAVFTVMVYAYVLFMVFPIYNTIDTLDKNQIEAARDLGASAWKIHTRVVIPHAKPGIAVGSIMTFMLSAGSIAVPEIVGRGLHPDWFSQLIYRRFFEADSWNQGSAYSLALLIACIVFIFATMAIFKVGIRDIAK